MNEQNPPTNRHRHDRLANDIRGEALELRQAAFALAQQAKGLMVEATWNLTHEEANELASIARDAQAVYERLLGCRAIKSYKPPT